MPNSTTSTNASPLSDTKAVKREPGEAPKIEYRTKPKVVKAVDKSRCKLSRLMEYLDSIKGQKFTGYIKVNFTQGTVGRVERFEEILRK
jgi:hypothetical protein